MLAVTAYQPGVAESGTVTVMGTVRWPPAGTVSRVELGAATHPSGGCTSGCVVWSASLTSETTWARSRMLFAVVLSGRRVSVTGRLPMGAGPRLCSQEPVNT